MLRRHHRFFQSLQVLRDALFVACAFYLAYVGRFSFPAMLPFHTVSSTHETLAMGTMLVAVWPAVGWAGGLYVSKRAHNAISDVFDVFKTTSIAFLVLVTLTYFIRDVRYSRAVLLIWAVLCCVLLSAARVGSKIVLRRIRHRGFNLRHLFVVGTGKHACHVVETVSQQSSLGLRVAGAIELVPGTAAAVASAPVVGSILDLPRLLTTHRIDQVVVALAMHELGALRGLMDILSKETVDVRLVPDFDQYITLCGSVEEFSGLPIINLQSSPLFGWNLLVKRSFDILTAALGIVAAAPLFGLLAVWVKLSSPGPIFYAQERVGMDGRHFLMLKFRTMRLNAETSGAQMTVRGDPRCTSAGAFLRRFSLDELPQLLNVLRGDMSLVGPRPERPCFIDTFKQEIPRYALRHKIKAGMTGWAQINGLRGNTSIAKRIELDLYYIENWSLVLDLKILLRTVLGGFISPNAY